MADIDQATAIAQHMRAKGKPDDQIRDTLRAWDLGEKEVQNILATLPAAPDGTPADTDDPHEHAVALAAHMRRDGRADDMIRDSLRACDVSDKEIDNILAAAPPAGTPVSHELPPERRPSAFVSVMRALTRFWPWG